jgi:hypothetical protein
MEIKFDSAGKHGAGLALEVLGRSLRWLNIAPECVVIINKLGWLRSPLRGGEPTFEPGGKDEKAEVYFSASGREIQADTDR